MNNVYNSNLYLATKDLNDIENKIEELTQECKKTIYRADDTYYTGTSFQIVNKNYGTTILTQIDGDTSQNGTPTPDNPVEVETVTGRQEIVVCGKNLLPNEAKTQTINGLTFTINDDKSISISGTSTTTTILLIGYINLPSGTYTISTHTEGSVNNSCYINTVRVSDNTNITGGTINLRDANKTTMILEENTNVYSRFYTGANRTFTNFKIYPMLEKNSINTEYEPYKGQSYEINLGKNLSPSCENYIFRTNAGASYVTDTNSITVTTAISNASGIYLSESNATNKSLCPYFFEEGYIFSCDVVADMEMTLRIGTSAGYQTYTIGTEKTRISCPTANANFTIYNRSSNSATFILSNFQVEKGSQTTSYSPYKTPIELCRIEDYRNRIFKNEIGNPYYDSSLEDDKWYLYKVIDKVVLDGSETWARSIITGTTDTMRYSTIVGTLIPNLGYCDKFINRPNDMPAGDYECLLVNNRRIYISIKISRLDSETLDNFKAWLSSNNVTVYYVPSEPVIEEITDTELLNQLNDIELLSGVNNITVSSDNLSGVITIYHYSNNDLRNIKVGDSLNSKILYTSFPRTLYESIPNDNVVIIQTNVGNSIRFYKHVYSTYNSLIIELVYNNKNYTIYRKDTDEDYIRYNIKKYKLPFDFGIVTNIYTDNVFYQYLKVCDNDIIIPAYTKHTWVDNEVLSMQKIDNIEEGVKNIGYYYYKPNGWIGVREWLKTCNITDYNNNKNIQNISYQDLNRWINNLNLISFDDLDTMTIWNTILSRIEWNKENGIEWEDF